MARSAPKRPSRVGPCDENAAIESIETIGWRPFADAPLDMSFLAIEGVEIVDTPGPPLPAETTMTMSSWSQTKRSKRMAVPSSTTPVIDPHELLWVRASSFGR